MQGRQGASGNLFGKCADRGQGCQIKEHPLDVLVPGFVLQRVDRMYTLSLVAAGDDQVPVGVRGSDRSRSRIPYPGSASREDDGLGEVMCMICHSVLLLTMLFVTLFFSRDVSSGTRYGETCRTA